MDTQLYIDLPKTSFQPGETISGEILWALNEAPMNLNLSLGWWTEGKGTKDAKIETELEWPASESAGRQAFEIELPPTPYSFEGHLISLKWALEVRTQKGKQVQSVELTISPNDTPIELPLVEDESR